MKFSAAFFDDLILWLSIKSFLLVFIASDWTRTEVVLVEIVKFIDRIEKKPIQPNFNWILVVRHCFVKETRESENLGGHICALSDRCHKCMVILWTRWPQFKIISSFTSVSRTWFLSDVCLLMQSKQRYLIWIRRNFNDSRDH